MPKDCSSSINAYRIRVIIDIVLKLITSSSQITSVLQAKDVDSREAYLKHNYCFAISQMPPIVQNHLTSLYLTFELKMLGILISIYGGFTLRYKSLPNYIKSLLLYKPKNANLPTPNLPALTFFPSYFHQKYNVNEMPSLVSGILFIFKFKIQSGKRNINILK